MSKNKIMHLIASTSVAGAENVLKTLLDNVDHSRFQHHVANFVDLRVQEPNQFRKLLIDSGYSVDDVPIARVYDWRQVSRIRSLVKQNDINLLHTNGYRSDFLGYMAVRKTGIPILSTVHGTDRFSGRFEIKPRLRLNLWRKVLRRFDKIIAVSRDLHEELIGSGVPAERVVLLRNAITFPNPETSSSRPEFREKMGIDAKTKLIGVVGRLSREKGHDYMIQALPSCLGNDADIKCIIVGDGPRRKTLEKLADELCPRGTVEFLGYRDDVQSIYPALDVFVLPSLIEGTPMALLEAMASKLPIVATAVGGIPDIIKDGVNGVLVEPRSSESLARGIRELLHNSDLAQEMVEKNLDLLAQEFDVTKWVRSIEEIYASLTLRQDSILK